MSITHDGRYGEVAARLWLKKKGFSVFQVDWIAQDKDGQYYTVECKHQEMYEPPPFAGHGLPIWQMRRRLQFQLGTGVRAILAILDKKTNEWLWQYLDILELGEYYDTQGKSPRRVYPINSFIVEPPIEQFELIARLQ